MPLLAPASSDNQVLVSIGSKSDTAAIDKTSQSVKGLSNSTDEASAKSDLFGAAANAAKIAVIALGAATAAAGVSAVKSAADFEQNRVAFQVMLGSADKAQQLMEQMAQFAKTTPFTLPEVEAGAKQLLAYGIAQKDLIPSMTRLGDLAAGLGVPFNQLALAYGQVAVKGHLMGSEALQFMNAGVPIVQTLAKVLHKTTAEIQDMQAAGTISFADVQKAIESLTDKGSQFGGMMDKQSQTFDGVVSNISDGFGAIGRAAVGMDNAGNIVSGSFFDRIKKAAFAFMPIVQDSAGAVGDYSTKILNYFDKVTAVGAKVFNYLLPSFKALGSGILDLVKAGKNFAESDFMRIIGGAFVIGLGAAMTATGALLSVFSSFVTSVGNSPGPMIGLIAALGAYKLAVTSVTVATDAWKASQLMLNAVLDANPIYLAIAAVVGITAAVAASAWQNDQTSGATDRLSQARQRLTDSTNAAKDAENRLKDSQLDSEGAALRVEHAQNDYNDAIARFGPKSLEARDAAHNLKEAQNDLEKATAAVRDRTQEVKDKQDIVIKNKAAVQAALDGVKNSAYNAASGFSYLADQIENVNNKQNSISSGKALPLSLGSLGLKKNAQGTGFFPGGLSMVGENGPEIVEMPRGAKVLDAKSSANMMGGGVDQSQSTTFHIAQLIIQPQTYDAGRGVFDTLNNDSVLAGKNLTVNGG